MSHEYTRAQWEAIKKLAPHPVLIHSGDTVVKHIPKQGKRYMSWTERRNRRLSTRKSRLRNGR